MALSAASPQPRRFPFRVEGEHAYRLAPFAFSAEDPGLVASTAMTHSAVQLFVERAVASGVALDLNDSDAKLFCTN
jgi:predicted ATPase